MSRTSFFRIGFESLPAARLSGGNVTYRDDVTRSRWRVARKDVTTLGRMLEAGTRDAYSIWCGRTDAVETSR